MKRFTKNKENFTCGKCGFFVVGNGYTDHCPKCLWSKHVDISPGDRLAKCGGMMEPINIEILGKEDSIINKCILCGHIKKNKLSKMDDYDTFTLLAKR